MRDIILQTPPEVAEISDKSTFLDFVEKKANPNEIVDESQQTANQQESIKVVLKNVSTGYDTLRHIHSFI